VVEVKRRRRRRRRSLKDMEQLTLNIHGKSMY